MLVMLTAGQASAEDSGKYREFTIGSTTASVFEITGSRSSDLRTVHSRPSLLQEFVWRPRYTAGRPLPDVDPVNEMLFSFFDDQLYRIVVYYDRARTAGLTHDDLVLMLSDIYGAAVVSPVRSPTRDLFQPSDATMPIAMWEDGDTVVSLYWSDYRAAFGLAVMSQTRDAAARLAAAAAVTLDEREAPAREAARHKQDAADRKAADERTRATNKGAFRP
jgi:hypothetical protein